MIQMAMRKKTGKDIPGLPKFFASLPTRPTEPKAENIRDSFRDHRNGLFAVEEYSRSHGIQSLLECLFDEDPDIRSQVLSGLALVHVYEDISVALPEAFYMLLIERDPAVVDAATRLIATTLNDTVPSPFDQKEQTIRLIDDLLSSDLFCQSAYQNTTFYTRAMKRLGAVIDKKLKVVCQ